MQWNVLVIDDDADIANNVAELISGHKVLAEPDNVVCRVESSFDNAIGLLQTSRFDLLILDLKDDEIDAETKDDEDLSGERVLAALRSVRFTPVIFHSGFAHKVEGLKSPFVRVVAKGETELLRLLTEPLQVLHLVPRDVDRNRRRRPRQLLDHGAVV